MADRHKIAIRGSGAATAEGSGFANSGNFQGDVYQVLPQPLARSAYLQTVRRIAPRELVGRQAELRELEEFCISVDAAEYVYWQAPAWAGKSALMSFFVLHPPAGVRIASFFITARFSSQSDRRAFIHVMAEQLAEVAKLPMPVLTDVNEDAVFLEMLDEAAAACRRQGQRLILVIDGLDEDRGVVIGSDMYSIAALLPTRLPADVRAVVAGRPDPPIPNDVPDGHPLRLQAIVRKLDASPRAQVIRADAERELRGLLHGTPAQQDLLGLVTAAGGGLSGRDLAELSGLDPWEVEEYLHTVSGRTFATRESLWHSEIVYVLAHEELQKTSLHYLAGGRLNSFRERLHSWAERYRQKGWPSGTPEYLLSGYYRLLQEETDQDRMVVCALDEARHNRMLDVTGGDADALSEIIAAHRMVADRPMPDLLTSLRLAQARHSLKDRNKHIPDILPGIWVRLGYSARGEALARSISDPYQQSQAFIALVRAEYREKGWGSTRNLVEQAEQIASAIDNSHQRTRALADLSRVIAEANDLTWAEHIARAIHNSYQKAEALADIVEISTATGQLDWARAISDDILDAEQQARAYMALVEATVRAGELQRARRLASDVQQIVGAIPDDSISSWVSGLPEALTDVGQMRIGEE